MILGEGRTVLDLVYQFINFEGWLSAWLDSD